MSQWSPDTCGCVFEMDDATFAHVADVVLCPRHKTCEEAYADCRAKNAVVAQAAKVLGVDAGMVAWRIDFDGQVHALDDKGAPIATSAPLSHDQFVAAVGPALEA